MTSSLKIPAALEPAVKAITDRTHRYVVLYGGRGSGKSWNTARILLNVGRHIPLRVLCTREIQKTIAESVHQLLVEQISAMGFESFYEVTKDTIRGKNGTDFIFSGLRQQDITKLKSLEGVDVAWVEEGQVTSEKSLDVLIPTIRKKDSMIWVTFNPELEDDPVYKRFIVQRPPNALCLKVNYNDNTFFPDVLESERAYLESIDESPGQAKYQNIWEGECLPAVEGAIFAHEIAQLYDQGRFRLLDHDPKGKVYGVMDLGWGVSTMVLAQRFASTVQIIGYYEWMNRTYADISRELKTNHPDFEWGKIFMPHDAAHRDPKYGKSHFEVMEEQGWDTAQIPQIGVENYIEAGRAMFGNVYVSTDCERLIHCLRRFRYQSAQATGRTMAPLKDEFSHGAEAWCYTAVVADDMVNNVPVPNNPYTALQEVYAG